MVNALGDQWEITQAEHDGELFEIYVDAPDPMEAALRVAVALDEIDPYWGERFEPPVGL